MAVFQPVPETATPFPRSQSRDDQNFSITSPVEVLFVLNAVMEEKSLITLYLERSNCFILSSILAVDPQKKTFVLDYGIDESLNQLAQKRGNLLCVTTQNRIKIEFVCNSLQKIQFEGGNAFRAAIPTSLKRIQRRNFYRILTPVATPATCSIPLSQSNKEEPAIFNLLDISCGGMALIDQHPDINLEPGTIFEHCQLDLPEFGIIETTIQVRNTCTMMLKNGLSCQRAGCEFIGLSGKSRALIQRYLIRLEQQERKFNGGDDA
jgi:c-di-GMP-binding flagellar brake protein YcgR